MLVNIMEEESLYIVMAQTTKVNLASDNSLVLGKLSLDGEQFEGHWY